MIVIDTKTLFSDETCRHADQDAWRQCVLDLIPAPLQRPTNPCDGVTFGTHHKTGTVLAADILRQFCGKHALDQREPSLALRLSHASVATIQAELPPGSRLAHFIRDPLETIVSGYQYHMINQKEQWLFSTGYQEKIRNATAVSLQQGLEFEYKGVAAETINQMITTHQFLTAANNSMNLDSFTLRMEHLADEFQFRVAMEALDKFFGLEKHISMEEWEKCCYVNPKSHKQGAGTHVMNGSEKEKLREILMSTHGQEIIQMRSDLGFPLIGKEGDLGFSLTEEGSSLPVSNNTKEGSSFPVKNHTTEGTSLSVQHFATTNSNYASTNPKTLSAGIEIMLPGVFLFGLVFGVVLAKLWCPGTTSGGKIDDSGIIVDEDEEVPLTLQEY